MDVLPNGGIFKELQLVHDTGYFSSACSLEEHWQQVSLNICQKYSSDLVPPPRDALLIRWSSSSYIDDNNDNYIF